MQHASQSGMCVPSETTTVNCCARSFRGYNAKHTARQTQKHTPTHLGSPVVEVSRAQISLGLSGIDSRCTESSRHSRAGRRRPAVPGSPLPNDTLKVWTLHAQVIDHMIRPGVNGTHTHIHLHTPGGLVAHAASYPVTRERRNGGAVSVCVCVSSPSPRWEL